MAEDQDAVRALVCQVLRKKGYRVLEARHGEEAIEISRRYAGPIDLLATDVVMPGISGRDLASRLTAERPDIKVLYMSGYADETVENAALRAGEPGASVLRKPFTPARLLSQVCEVLAGSTATRGASASA